MSAQFRLLGSLLYMTHVLLSKEDDISVLRRTKTTGQVQMLKRKYATEEFTYVRRDMWDHPGDGYRCQES